MSLSAVDVIWSHMRNGELYSPRDLANCSGRTMETTVRVLEFLARYGFAERVVNSESIFRKAAGCPAPGDAVKTLRMIVNDGGVLETGRVLSASRSRELLDPL